jgi:hypothetical protein
MHICNQRYCFPGSTKTGTGPFPLVSQPFLMAVFLCSRIPGKCNPPPGEKESVPNRHAVILQAGDRRQE